MKKKEVKKEDAIVPKTQIVRLKKLFSGQAGKETNKVDPSRLN